MHPTSLADNLAALRTLGTDPLAHAPAAAPPRYVLHEADGTLRLRTADGRVVRLESARNPRGEADAVVNATLAHGAASTLAVVGVGPGALLESVLTRGIRALVIEFDAELAAAWLSQRSWVDEIAAGRLRVIVGPEYVGAADAARFVEGTDRIPVVAHPVLAREYPAEMATARAVLDRVVRDALANANARERFEDLALVNTVRNLPSLAASGDVGSLFGRFADVPAIIVGAGPSLDANLEAIAGVQTRALVIATDTALLPCLRAGIVPPLVMALDPSEANGRHLTACAGATDTYLVTEASVDPAGVTAFAGRTLVFRVGDHAPWPWLGTVGVARGRLSVWGSVATAALDLALKAGCPLVAFAGLDLAFTGGRPYCRGTVLEESWAWEVANGHPLEAQWTGALASRVIVEEPDVHGTAVATASHLLAFRDWMRETAAAHPEVRFANGTGAGILHGGRIAQQPLVECLRDRPAQGYGAFAATIRASQAASHEPGLGRRLAATLERTRLLDVAGGHSSPERAATHVLSPELLAQTRRALLDAGSREAAAPDRAAAFATGPRIQLPEQTAILQALTAGSPLPRGGDVPRAMVPLHDAYQQLRTLLPAARGVRPRPLTDVPAWWNRVPARLLCDWPPSLTEAVDTFGSRLAEAIRLGKRDGVISEGIAVSKADCLLGESAVDPDAPSTAIVEAALASATLVWQWTLVCALAASHDQWLTRAVLALATTPPALLPDDRPAIRLNAWIGPSNLNGAGEPVPFLHEFAVARAITGLAGTRGPAAPRRPDEVDISLSLPGIVDGPLVTVAAIEPESLLLAGQPRAHIVTRLSDDDVLVGRSDGSGIAVMSASGQVVRLETWPRPARVSIPIGKSGRLAWQFPDAPRLLHREVADGPVTIIELPVTVFDALTRPDGEVLLATDDGLWTWRPGAQAAPLVRGPWLVSLSRQGNGVQARGRPGWTQQDHWEATTVLLEWQPGDTEFRRIPVAAGAAPFAVDERAGWRAEAWLDAAVVRLVRPDRREFWLACSGPRSLAWAGGTLYVATVAGEVLRFPDLTVRLAAV